MATNDFLTFAGDPAADVLPQSQYIATGFTARILGFSTGTALSIQLNKVWRQASLISAMIGQFTVDEINQDMLDDGTPAGMTALETHFRAALVHVAQSSIGTNFLPLTGGALSGPLQINASTLGITAPSGSVAINLTRQQGQYAFLAGYTGTFARWQVFLPDNAPEQGGNSGSNFDINSFNDQGGYLDTPLSINRATGVVNFSHGPTVNGASLPYVRLAGDVMSGALGVGSTGISYNGLGGYWAQHHIAFGWDGNVNVAVDGTFVGQIAMQSWVGAVVGGYLPLGGGNLSGQLNVYAPLEVFGTAFHHSTTFFGYTDFANFWDGRYRYRQWAGSWYDAWDGQTGLRAWAAPGAWIMTLDGTGSLYVRNILRVDGSRIISASGLSGGGVAPSVCCYWTGGVAKGMWVDGTGLWLGQMDGNGNPLRADVVFDKNGYMTFYGSASINGSLWVGNQVAAAGSIVTNYFSCNGAGVFNGHFTVNNDANVGGTMAATVLYSGSIVQAHTQVYSYDGGGASLNADGVMYNGNGVQIGWRWDGNWMWCRINGWEKEVIVGNNQRVRNLQMYSTSLQWTDSDNSGWLANTYRSDPRFKRNIREADDFDSLSAICATPTKSFEWREDYRAAPVPYGMISTDVRMTLPDAVMEAPSEGDEPPVDHLDPPALFAHLFRAIAQLNRKIAALEARHV
jgi:hypothetical protein